MPREEEGRRFQLPTSRLLEPCDPITGQTCSNPLGAGTGRHIPHPTGRSGKLFSDGRAGGSRIYMLPHDRAQMSPPTPSPSSPHTRPPPPPPFSPAAAALHSSASCRHARQPATQLARSSEPAFVSTQHSFLTSIRKLSILAHVCP